MRALYQANIDVLQQLADLIEHCRCIYGRTPQSSPSAIGRHVRHVLDHYRALQSGLAAGCVDYDQRLRQHACETDPDLALAELASVIRWLQQWPAERPLRVKSEISVRVQQYAELSSSISRELLYLINHSIHHIAYAALLAEQSGITVPAELGIAPATASDQRTHEEELHD